MNGLGEEFLVGETNLAPLRPLFAWPLPYRGGRLRVSFETPGMLSGGKARTEVGIYDVAGRRVRTVLSGPLAAGYHTVTWNGRDEAGHPVPSGIYFVRSRSAEHDRTLKLVVLR